MRAVYLNLFINLHLDVAPRNETEVQKISKSFEFEHLHEGHDFQKEYLVKNDQELNKNKEVIMEIVDDQLTSYMINDLQRNCFEYISRKENMHGFSSDPLMMVVLHTIQAMIKFGFYT